MARSSGSSRKAASRSRHSSAKKDCSRNRSSEDSTSSSCFVEFSIMSIGPATWREIATCRNADSSIVLSEVFGKYPYLLSDNHYGELEIRSHPPISALIPRGFLALEIAEYVRGTISGHAS